MNFRDFRIGWRLLVADPVYSAVVILGLSVGFAIAILLLGFVRYSFSYDATIPNAQRIYQVQGKTNGMKPAWQEKIPLPFFDLIERSELVESATAIKLLEVSVKVDAQVHALELSAAYPSFQRMFDIKPIEGDLQEALTRPDRLALTRSMAGTLFGHQKVVGKTVHIAGKPFLVAALLEDPPANSTVTYTALASIATAAWAAEDRQQRLQDWGRFVLKTYVKLKNGASPVALARAVEEATENSPLVRQLGPDALRALGSKKIIEIRLVALRDMYFDGDTANLPGSGPHGDRTVLFGLSAVAALILLLAATNYLNLATVRTLQRKREIAIRKVLGASAPRLLRQFLAESILVALLATCLGLLLAWLLLPLFSELMDRKLDKMFSPATLLISLVLGIAVGAAAGGYPAWVALRVRPQDALAARGGSEARGGLWLRRVLTGFQFATAMALTSVTLAIAWQANFASQVDHGFDPRPLLVVEMPTNLINPTAVSLRDALARIPGVTGVAAAEDPIGRSAGGRQVFLIRNEGNRASVIQRVISANFFEVYGMRPVAGRLFDSKLDAQYGFESLVINRATARALGFATPEAAVGQIISTPIPNGSISGRIVGVAPDIPYESLRDAPRPILYYAAPQATVLTVRSSEDLRIIEGAADALARRYFPDDLIVIKRAQSYFAPNYADDVRLAKLLGMASIVTILIAAFGIYVLSAYSVQRRAKEIVLRKLHGANRRDIARMLGREFIALLGAGAIVGLPPAMLAIERYLSTYLTHAPIGGWTLLSALLVALVVSVGSTLRQTMIATRMSPAQVLRD